MNSLVIYVFEMMNDIQGSRSVYFLYIFFSDFTELKGSIGWLLVWHWACFRLGLIYAPTVKERR